MVWRQWSKIKLLPIFLSKLYNLLMQYIHFLIILRLLLLLFNLLIELILLLLFRRADLFFLLSFAFRRLLWGLELWQLVQLLLLFRGRLLGALEYLRLGFGLCYRVLFDGV